MFRSFQRVMPPDAGFETEVRHGRGDNGTESRVQIGAILMSSDDEKEPDPLGLGPCQTGIRLGLFTALPGNKLSVLGNNLSALVSAKLREAGVESPMLVPEGVLFSEVLRHFTDGTIAEAGTIAIPPAHHLDVLLLLRAGEYTDLDFKELLQFHLARNSAFTQVYDEDGPVDIAVVSPAALRNLKGISQGRVASERFHYDGYINRLRKPSEYMHLIEDALHGRCNLRPIGTEVAPGIWFGAGAVVDDSCVIAGPAFIGAETRIAAGCTISAGSAIERACKIDTGTTVAQSWILQNTYIGVGLSVRRTIVANRKIFHLDRDTEIAIKDHRLIGVVRSHSLAESIASFFGQISAEQAS
jgi:hypothetical protein